MQKSDTDVHLWVKKSDLIFIKSIVIYLLYFFPVIMAEELTGSSCPHLSGENASTGVTRKKKGGERTPPYF